MVRKYTDKQLLDKVKSLSSFKEFPKGYWLLGVRSINDKPDEFDDKFYLFHNTDFIMVTTGTTNPGVYSLLNYTTYNTQGSAVVKADEWYYDLWKNGLHKNKMKALIQSKPIKYYRDNNKNLKSEEINQVQSGYIGINFHSSSYEIRPIVTDKIGKWSYGCQVCNNIKDYYSILDKVKNQGFISYCLIKEFDTV